MLPSQLRFTNKINSAYARNFNSVLQPQNTSSSDVGQTSVINIPCGPNMFLSGADTVLAFTLGVRAAADSANVTMCRAGASNCISRLRAFHGSTLIQDTSSYGQLASLLSFAQRSKETVDGKCQLT